MAYTTVTVTPLETAAQFRSNYPEFADSKLYPDSSVTYWLTVATVMLNPARWGTLLQLATELFVAHQLVVEAQALQTGQVGGWPGVSKGAISSESPGDVTVNYDTDITLEKDGGNWNLTVYGSRLLHWIRLAGAGPIQVGPGCGSPGTVAGSSNGVGGWAGPSCWPGWFS